MFRCCFSSGEGGEKFQHVSTHVARFVWLLGFGFEWPIEPFLVFVVGFVCFWARLSFICWILCFVNSMINKFIDGKKEIVAKTQLALATFVLVVVFYSSTMCRSPNVKNFSYDPKPKKDKIISLYGEN